MPDIETQARERVYNDERLLKHIGAILHRWSNWDEHIEWVATAPVEEIVDWAETVVRDDDVQQ